MLDQSSCTRRVTQAHDGGVEPHHSQPEPCLPRVRGRQVLVVGGFAGPHRGPSPAAVETCVGAGDESRTRQGLPGKQMPRPAASPAILSRFFWPRRRSRSFCALLENGHSGR